MTSRKKYRLALIEPSEIVRTGVKALLAAEGSFELTATAADIRQWSAFPPALPPDVLLVNPSLADRHGRTHIRTLLSAEASTLVGALLYTYLPQEELAQYDCVVEIDDPKETVVKKLLHALQNRERENEPRTVRSGKGDPRFAGQRPYAQGDRRHPPPVGAYRDLPPEEHLAQDRYQNRIGSDGVRTAEPPDQARRPRNGINRT